MADKRELEEAFRFFLNGELERMIFSNPRNRDHYIKMTVRPLMLKGTLKFQVEEFTEKQAFQKNMDRVISSIAPFFLSAMEKEMGSQSIIGRPSSTVRPLPCSENSSSSVPSFV